MLNVRIIGQVLHACEGIVSLDSICSEVDRLLAMKAGAFRELLIQSQLMTLDGDIPVGVTAQDLINVLLLYLALSKEHSLVATSFHRK